MWNVSLSVCSAVSDMVQLQRSLSEMSLNYFGDAVWMWCIIALKRAMSTTGPLHYMKPNRWLSATCVICRGDLSDFRCNNCQRNDRPNQKAISSNCDNITLWRPRKQRHWKISNIIGQQIAYVGEISLSKKSYQDTKTVSTAIYSWILVKATVLWKPNLVLR